MATAAGKKEDTTRDPQADPRAGDHKDQVFHQALEMSEGTSWRDQPFSEQKKKWRYSCRLLRTSTHKEGAM
jgi:hypothetical protein